MEVAVVGGRTFDYYELLKTALDSYKITHIISGGAAGADILATVYSREHNKCFEDDDPSRIELVVYLPEWIVYGKRAGAVRNQLIVNDAEMMVAFWDGEPKGTKISIDMAKRKGIPVEIVYY